MIYCRLVAAAILAGLLQSSVILAQFELEVVVQSFEDPVDDCGGGFDICALYLDRFCLSRQSEDPETCSLARRTGDLDLDDLPETVTLSSSQPWPIDFQLHLEIMDSDTFNSDDDIDEIVVQTSLNTSSQFSAEVEFTGDRISLFLLFRVRCTGDYMGPHCDCLPHNDTVNGHYWCKEDGGISCLPGYTNTSDLCRQAAAVYVPVAVDSACDSSPCLNGATCTDLELPGDFECLCPPDYTSPDCGTAVDHCTDIQCPANSVCVNGNCSPQSTLPDNSCSCDNGGSCVIVEDKNSAQYICVCPEGFTGDKCSTKISPSPQPRSQEGSGGMPKAAIAGIVAGVLLAALVCAVLVVVGLCVRHRRSRRSQVMSKPQNGRRPLATENSVQGLVANPAYESVRMEKAIGSLDTTLRKLQNPLYGEQRKGEEVIYSVPDKPSQKIGAGEEVYSVPDVPARSKGREGESGAAEEVYSVPDVPARSKGREGESGAAEETPLYSYATVGTGPGDGANTVKINEDILPSPLNSDSPYNTLDHGTQTQEKQQRLAEQTTAYEALATDTS